jgi:SAM-dependent methyltransferase
MLEHVIDLGKQPPSNALKREQHATEKFYPLRAMVCANCFLMQLDTDVERSEMFNEDYVYLSGMSADWLRHCKDYADMAMKRFRLDRRSAVAEIGGNDGSLLRNFYRKVDTTINIEPSESAAKLSYESGEVTCTQVKFFVVLEYPVDLIIANNVMAHVPDLRKFVADIRLSLKPRGTVTVEFPHALTLLQGGQFDTIYHEHYSYLSLTALEPIFRESGLTIYDVEKLPTHGGSLRVYASPEPYSISGRIYETYAEEEPLRKMLTYMVFERQAVECRNNFRYWFDVGLKHNASGKLLAYGAAAKGNTFLNYCGLTYKEISMVADTTPTKQGLFLPGSCIPVVDEATVLAQKPEWLLVLPWNWKDEIAARVRAINPKQRMITAVPSFGEC